MNGLLVQLSLSLSTLRLKAMTWKMLLVCTLASTSLERYGLGSAVSTVMQHCCHTCTRRPTCWNVVEGDALGGAVGTELSNADHSKYIQPYQLEMLLLS